MGARIESLRIGPEKNFTYLILCPETHQAALVDAAFEFDRVIDWIRKIDPEVHIGFLVATHGHWDHSGGIPDMLKIIPTAKVVAGEAEKNRLFKSAIKVDVPLRDGEILNVGNIKVKAVHTPGHTEGGTCFLVEDHLLSGDTLFVGQCGRTDLAGGSDKELFQSLQKLKTLPPNTIVLPGHDYGPTPKSTLRHEIETNPTMKAQTLDEFINLP